MSGAAKGGRKMIRLMNSAVDMAVLIAVMLLIVVGCFAIWDSKQVYQAADATRYEVFKPTVENGSLSFAELKAINPEVFGWLTVYGTHIDYPIVQGQDNMKYVNTNAKGEYSLSGSVFLDYSCAVDLSDFSSLFYGHHMERGAMFGDIENFAEKSYFENHLYGALFYDEREHGLEFFAFLHVDAYDGSVFRTKIIGREAQQEYLEHLLALATHTRDIPVTPDDRIVLLSTCSSTSTNGRDILVGRITDEVFADPFIMKETDNVKIALTVDGLPDLWAGVPLWGKAAIVVLPLSLLILLSMKIKKKKRSRKGRDHDHMSCEGVNACEDKRN